MANFYSIYSKYCKIGKFYAGGFNLPSSTILLDSRGIFGITGRDQGSLRSAEEKGEGAPIVESGVLIWLNPSFSRVIEKILTKLFSISPISYSSEQVLFPETDRGKTPLHTCECDSRSAAAQKKTVSIKDH